MTKQQKISPCKAFGYGATFATVGALVLIIGLVTSAKIIPGMIGSAIDKLARIDPEAFSGWAYGQNITAPNHYKTVHFYGLCSTLDDPLCDKPTAPSFFEPSVEGQLAPLIREYGPFVFVEKGSKKNVVFSVDNCTVSYKREITTEFVPELSFKLDKDGNKVFNTLDGKIKYRVWNPAFMGIMQYTGGSFGFNALAWHLVLSNVMKMVSSDYAISTTLAPGSPNPLKPTSVFNIYAFTEALAGILLGISIPPGFEPYIVALTPFITQIIDAYTGFSIGGNLDQTVGRPIFPTVDLELKYTKAGENAEEVTFFVFNSDGYFSGPAFTDVMGTYLQIPFFSYPAEDPLRMRTLNLIKPAMDLNVINQLFTNNKVLINRYQFDENGDLMDAAAEPTKELHDTGYAYQVIDFLTKFQQLIEVSDSEFQRIINLSISIKHTLEKSGFVLEHAGPCFHPDYVPDKAYPEFDSADYCNARFTIYGLDVNSTIHVQAFNVIHLTAHYFNIIKNIQKLILVIPDLNINRSVSPDAIVSILGFSHTHLETAENLIRGYDNALMGAAIPGILPSLAPFHGLDGSRSEVLSTGMCDGDEPRMFVDYRTPEGQLDPSLEGMIDTNVYPDATGIRMTGYDGTMFPRQPKITYNNFTFPNNALQVFVPQVFRAVRFELAKVYDNDFGVTVGQYDVIADLLDPTTNDNHLYNVKHNGIVSNFGALTPAGFYPRQNNEFAFLSQPHFLRVNSDRFSKIRIWEGIPNQDSGKTDYILHIRPNITKPYDEYEDPATGIVNPFTDQLDLSWNTSITVEPISGTGVGVNNQLMGGINPPEHWFTAVTTTYDPSIIVAPASALKIINGDNAHVPYYLLQERVQLNPYSANALIDKLYAANDLADNLTIAFATIGAFLFIPGVILLITGWIMHHHQHRESLHFGEAFDAGDDSKNATDKY